MSDTINNVQKILNEAFAPLHLDIVDESRQDLIDLTDLADGTPTW